MPLGVHSGLSYLGVHTKQSVDMEMIKLMCDLQSKSVSLALASNSGKTWIESVWKQIDNAPTIHKLITPEVGAIKPEPAYFRYVLAEIQTKPSEVVFVDDRQVNCIAASEAGIDAFWYQGSVADLHKHLGLPQALPD